MFPSEKSVTRKRLVVGWRESKRKVTENKSRMRPPPPSPLAKREG